MNKFDFGVCVVSWGETTCLNCSLSVEIDPFSPEGGGDLKDPHLIPIGITHFLNSNHLLKFHDISYLVIKQLLTDFEQNFSFITYMDFCTFKDISKNLNPPIFIFEDMYFKFCTVTLIDNLNRR